MEKDKEVGINGKDGEGEIELKNPVCAKIDNKNAPGPSRDSGEKELLRTPGYMRVLQEVDKLIENMSSFVLHDPSNNGSALILRSKYEYLLSGLYVRPRSLKMEVIRGIDELATFCKAVTEGWRLWPGEHSPGLQKMIDYLAIYTLTADIKRLEVPFLLTLKAIAIHDWGKNAGIGDHFMSPQAKKIIFQNKGRILPEEEAGSTWANIWQDTGFKITSALVLRDTEICQGIDCLEMDWGSVIFLRCGKCKKALYHSIECQTKAWYAGHEQVCKAPV